MYASFYFSMKRLSSETSPGQVGRDDTFEKNIAQAIW